MIVRCAECATDFKQLTDEHLCPNCKRRTRTAPVTDVMAKSEGLDPESIAVGILIAEALLERPAEAAEMPPPAPEQPPDVEGRGGEFGGAVATGVDVGDALEEGETVTVEGGGGSGGSEGGTDAGGDGGGD